MVTGMLSLLQNEMTAWGPGRPSGNVDVTRDNTGKEFACQPFTVSKPGLEMDFFYVRGGQQGVRASQLKHSTLHGVILDYPEDKDLLYSGVVQSYWNLKHPARQTPNICSYREPSGILSFDTDPPTIEATSLARDCSERLSRAGFESFAHCWTRPASIAVERTRPHWQSQVAKLPPMESQVHPVDRNVNYPFAMAEHLAEILNGNRVIIVLQCAFREANVKLIARAVTLGMKSPGVSLALEQGLKQVVHAGVHALHPPPGDCNTLSRNKAQVAFVVQEFEMYFREHPISPPGLGSSLADIVPEALCGILVKPATTKSDARNPQIEACEDLLFFALRSHTHSDADDDAAAAAVSAMKQAS
jgi:hypothetical protein